MKKLYVLAILFNFTVLHATQDIFNTRVFDLLELGKTDEAFALVYEAGDLVQTYRINHPLFDEAEYFVWRVQAKSKPFSW